MSNRIHIKPVDAKIPGSHYVTFSGARYDSTTKKIVELAPILGIEKVHVYDDRWLIEKHPEFIEERKELFEHRRGDKPFSRGFGWFCWKPFIILDALSKADDNDIVLYTDADCVPIADLAPLFKGCICGGGIMLFAACGFKQRHWCKRDCMALMGMDTDEWRDKQAGCARFMLFQKSDRSIRFLKEWLYWASQIKCNTFDESEILQEYPDLQQHRAEQAILTNLAHRYEIPLHREADDSGNCCLAAELKPKPAPIVGIMSLPLLSHSATWDCIRDAFYQCGLPGPLINDMRAGWWERGIQNMLARLVASGTEAAITLDYDSVFEAGDLANLINCFLANPSIDALAAYQPRRFDGQPMLSFDEQHSDPQKPINRAVNMKEPQRVRTAHFGLTIIRLSRLKDIPMPWFLNIPGTNGSWEYEAEGKIDADMYFWNKWHDHNRNVYVLPGARIGHLEQNVMMTDLDGVTRHYYYHELKAHQSRAFVVEKPNGRS